MITKIRPFQRNVDINRVMSEKNWFLTSHHRKLSFSRKVIINRVMCEKQFFTSGLTKSDHK